MTGEQLRFQECEDVTGRGDTRVGKPHRLDRHGSVVALASCNDRNWQAGAIASSRDDGTHWATTNLRDLAPRSFDDVVLDPIHVGLDRSAAQVGDALIVFAQAGNTAKHVEAGHIPPPAPLTALRVEAKPR